MQDVNLEADKKHWLSWAPYYKLGGVYVVWGNYGEAYIGLSRNIAIRLNQHNEEAKNGTHINDRFQRMYDDASGNLAYSVVWLSKSTWDTGGNYEASLIERHVVKELSNSLFVNVINNTKGGEIGGKGYRAVPVKITQWITGEVRNFRSIKACSAFLECSADKIKKANESRSYIGFWTVLIDDSLYSKRKAIKSKLEDSNETNYSSIVIGLIILFFIASC
jgi:hypothetical protein